MNTMQNNTFIGEDRGGAALRISFHLASLRDRNLPRRRIGLLEIFRQFQNNQLTALNVATNHEVIMKVKSHDSRKRKAENVQPITEDL